jgi:hypothetical protein
MAIAAMIALVPTRMRLGPRVCHRASSDGDLNRLPFVNTHRTIRVLPGPGDGGVCLLVLLGGSVTDCDSTPEEHVTVTGRPTTAFFAECVEVEAFATLAERVTVPPPLGSTAGEATKSDTVGRGAPVAPAGSGVRRVPKTTATPIGGRCVM